VFSDLPLSTSFVILLLSAYICYLFVSICLNECADVCADGKRLSSKRSCKFLEVSALLDHKVDDLLVTVIRLARQRRPSPGISDPRRLDNDDDEDDVERQQSCFQRAATFAFCRKLFK